jgi:hypothetical protein
MKLIPVTNAFNTAGPGDETTRHAQSLKQPVSEKRTRPMGSNIGLCGSQAFGFEADSQVPN